MENATLTRPNQAHLRPLWALVLVTAFVIVTNFVMTNRHNAQLMDMTAVHNQQLTKMTEEHNAQLAAQAAEFQKRK
jgi:hypothetical protein